MPSHVLVLNILKFREKLIQIPQLEANGEVSQHKNYRMSYFNAEFIHHMSQIEDYSRKFPNFLLEVQSHVNDQLLNDLIFSDSCDTLFYAGLIPLDQKSLCDSLLNGAFENGVIAGMNQIINNMKMQDLIIMNSTMEDILNFVKSKDNSNNVMVEYFYEKVLQSIFGFLTKYYTNLIINEITNLKTMIISFTIGVGIMIISLTIFYKKSLGNLYKEMSFSLNLIPYEKLMNDEQTIFLIKKFTN